MSFLRGLETFLKFATPIGAIVAFLVGIYHYRNSQAEEFKKEYWKKRYEVYEHLSDVASLLSVPQDSLFRDSLTTEFWNLYRGRTILVEDSHVYHALNAYAGTLERAKLPDSLPILQQRCIEMANACRLSLKETWEPVPVSEVRTMNK